MQYKHLKEEGIMRTNEEWLGGDFNDEFKPLIEPDEEFCMKLKKNARGKLITGEPDPNAGESEDDYLELTGIEIID